MYRIEKYLEDRPKEGTEDFLEVSQSRLELVSRTNTILDGEVRVRSRNGSQMHVFFYANHYRMHCPIGEFIGKEGVLTYRYDTTGLEEGSVEKGELCILSELGEYHIPFTVSIRQQLATTSLGEMRNLFHFANLARENWEEAVELFYSEDFSSLFYGHDRRYFDLYRGLSAHKGNAHNVDTFLKSIHKKTGNTYRVAEEGLLLKEVFDGHREHLTVVCSGWGYMSVRMLSRAEFLVPCKELLTNEDFDGNECKAEFEIRTAMLRPGTNSGVIVLQYEDGEAEVPVIVEMPAVKSRYREEKHQARKLMLQLMRSYIAYATLEGDSVEILGEAEKTVEKLNAGYGRNLWGRLFQIHILLETEREGEAKWVFSHIDKVQKPQETDSLALAYYLYLRAWLERSRSYTEGACQQIETLYEKEPENALLACLYVRMCVENMDERERMRIYEEQYESGSRNPILYLEALSVYKKSPVYLSKLENFEISVLSFAMRHNAYTEEMAKRVTEIAMRKKSISHKMFLFLCQSYEKYPFPEALQTLCTLMVRSQMSGRVYFPWYEKAIKSQLRITSLYEYYMMSADTRSDELMPRTVLMYFVYQCDLDERRKAFLYAMLVKHREEIPELFRQYEKSVGEFALLQMEKGIISENLAVLYRYVMNCQEQRIPREKIQKIAFRHLITTGKKNIINVVVVQDKLCGEMIYPFEKQRAYVDCYTDDYEIMLEDADGNRYCDREEWTDLKLMNVEKLVVYLEEQEADNIGFLLYRTNINGNFEQADEALWPVYEKLVFSEEVDSSYRMELSDKLLKLYFDRERYADMERLLERYEIGEAEVSRRAEVVRYLIYLEKYEKALEILYDYGFEGVPAKSLLRLADRWLAGEQGFNEKLMVLVYYTFRLGKYTNRMLEYLCHYFEGSLRQMKEIFKACDGFEVDASPLAERILQAYLFSHGYISGMSEVFVYYAEHRRRDSVMKLYVSDMLYRYLTGQQLPQPEAFRIAEEMLCSGSEMSGESIISYLYYMATEVSEYTDRQKELISRLVNNVISEKQYVPFFSRFAGFIPWIKPYTELTYLEYRTAPGRTVTLHYLKDGEQEQYCREVLREVCAGYYCCRFVLFFGERLQYYFMEQQGTEQMLTESGYLEKSDMTGEEGESRYGLLNDILMCEALGDMRTGHELIKKYEMKSYLAEELFGDC